MNLFTASLLRVKYFLSIFGLGNAQWKPKMKYLDIEIRALHAAVRFCILHNWICFSFDVENAGAPMVQSSSGALVLPTHVHHPGTAFRRESFLYRSDSDFEASPRAISRASSIASDV